jgi:hypothetical protein
MKSKQSRSTLPRCPGAGDLPLRPGHLAGLWRRIHGAARASPKPAATSTTSHSVGVASTPRPDLPRSRPPQPPTPPGRQPPPRRDLHSPKPAASPATYHRAPRAAPEPAATSATSHSAGAASTPWPALPPRCGPRCTHAGRIDLQPRRAGSHLRRRCRENEKGQRE